MAFELRAMREEDLPLMYPEVHDITLSPMKMLGATREYYLGRERKIYKINIAIDPSRQAFMIRGGLIHELGWDTYILGWGRGTAVICQRDYCVYEFYEITEDLLPKMEELKQLIAEALSVSGRNMKGNEWELDQVPYVNFWPYTKKGV